MKIRVAIPDAAGVLGQRFLVRSQSEGSSDFSVLNPEYIVLVTEQGKSPMTVGELEGLRTILRDGSAVTSIVPVPGG